MRLMDVVLIYDWVVIRPLTLPRCRKFLFTKRYNILIGIRLL